LYIVSVIDNISFVAVFYFQIEYELRKKEEGKKIRGEKDKVMDMLFTAFEKFQYYNVKDLVKVTKQPIVSFRLSLIINNNSTNNINNNAHRSLFYIFGRNINDSHYYYYYYHCYVKYLFIDFDNYKPSNTASVQ